MITGSEHGCGGCSSTYMRGFNYAPINEDEVADKIALCIGKMAYGYCKPTAGFNGDGYEFVMGTESNSDNPDAPSHHNYNYHHGDKFKEVVNKLGLGRVFLSPWTNGKGGSGSQIRTIMWDLPAKADLIAQVESIREEAKLYAAEEGAGDEDGALGLQFARGYAKAEEW